MFLQPNDTIALISPAGPIANKQPITDAKNLLKKWFLQTDLGKNALKSYGHFAGTDSERLADLQSALDNPKIKAIWALRGGYGSIRIVDQLDFTKFISHPKLLIGFSDISILHNKLQQLKIPSLHAIMPVQLKDSINDVVLKQTQNAFFGKTFQYSFNTSTYNKFPQNIKANVVGGNLANIYSLLGTQIDLDTQNKILFIEDVGENLYQIDRMIISLKKTGKLATLKALVVGQFTDIPDNKPYFGKTFQEIILEHTATYDYPIFFDAPIGHIPNNYPLLLGAVLQIDTFSDKITFTQLK